MNQGGLLLVSCIVLVAIDSSFGKKCFTCESASEESCRKEQKIRRCNYDEKCVTLTYSKTLADNDETIEINKIHKFCQQRDIKCDHKCISLWLGGVKSCKVDCCDTDYCNSVNVEVRTGKKRSNDNENTIKGASSQNHLNILQLLFLVIFAKWFSQS